MKSGGQTGSKGTGLEPNVASLLCYICMPITSLIFLVIEKENKDVRFHAWQGTFFGGALIALSFLLQILGALLGRLAGFMGIFFLNFLFPILWIGTLVLWVICLIKSYQGERWKIPILGDIAAKNARV